MKKHKQYSELSVSYVYLFLKNTNLCKGHAAAAAAALSALLIL